MAACGILASCASPDAGGEASARPSSEVAAPSAKYVETSTHRAPADPPTVTVEGVPAWLIYSEWATPDVSSPELASVTAPTELHWPEAPQLKTLIIAADKPPAAATINAFDGVDAHGIPSEKGMLTLNCELSPQGNQAAGQACLVADRASDGSIQVTVSLPRPFRYLVLWAQWWTWTAAKTTPAPETVHPVSASWAISSR